jgi:diguanylate cyclase (GGDEF)-like protein
MENTHISEMEKEIQIEYNRIDSKWLELHFKTSVGLFIFSFFVELALGYIMCNSEYLNTTVPMFIFKFILVPFSVNFICILVNFIVIRSKTISQVHKVYIISLLFVVICFVLFTVHVAFSALYFIFALPIMLTIIYADYHLTVITSALSMVGMVTSELFITWDLDKVNIFEDSIRLVDFLISLFILLAFSTVSMVVIRFEREKNAASIQKELERQQLQKKLQMDELTGIYNRRALHDTIKDMDTDTSDNNCIFVMLDIDNFKTLNDSFGHIFGDECLKRMGRILKKNCTDAIPFRYGGDEFCILFPNSSVEDTVKTCEKISTDLQAVSFENMENIKLTASIGISGFYKHMDSARLIVNADQALYAAKTVKNTIHIYSEADKC